MMVFRGQPTYICTKLNMMHLSLLSTLLFVAPLTLGFTPELSSRSSSTTSLAASRRDVLLQSSGIALSSLLLGQPALAAEPQTIVITGSNSGIGLEATKRLAAQGHKIVLACRTLAKAQDTAASLQGYGGTLIPAACDLASLKSIDEFVNQLPALIGSGSKIDALCLNAGIARNTADTDCARTADGFELTGK